MSLKDVKSKIRAVKKIHQVTKAMEAVSAVKMRRSQATAIEARPYALHAIGLLKRLLVRATHHPLAVHRAEERQVLIMVVTSDRGLAGALNSYVLRAAHRLIGEHRWSRESVAILAIGKKGGEHFARRGYRILEQHEHWGEGVSDGDPDTLARRVIAAYRSGTFDRVMLVYSNFESTFVQQPVVRRLLPLSIAAVREVIEGIVPARGKYSELAIPATREATFKHTLEPNADAVLDELVPFLIGVVLYHAALEANASEHSARMVAMKGASDRARDLTRALTRTYNKERQTAITAEVSEITSGIEAMR